MPAVPLGIGAYKRTGTPEARCLNFYLEADKSGVSPDKTLRVQRPGLTALDLLPSAIRALHYRTATSERLAVAGGQLYSATTPKGAIPGTGMAAIVSTPFLTAIVSSGSAYLYDTAVTALAMPDDAPAAGYVEDVDQLNGYALFLIANGRFYWLVPGETAIDPTHYSTAESLPDKGVALRRLGDEFWIFGTENIEVWQATGDQDEPFSRAAGRNFERGCLYRDAVRRFDNTLVWIGDDAQVYRASSVPQVISDPGITERIRKAAGPCSAWTFGIEGHSFYVLNIPGQGSFAFDAATQSWSEFASPGQIGWRPWTGYQVGGQTVAGASDTGQLFAVDPDATGDLGVAFERSVTGTAAIGGKLARNDSVSIGASASIDTTLRFRWRDGQDDYPDWYDGVEVFAPFDVATVWRLGSPDQPYREFEISCVEDARVTLFGLMANEDWR